MALIEDYALIGDCRTAALVSREARSIGIAARVSIPMPASRRFWEHLSTAAG
jgi:hypothetical protein